MEPIFFERNRVARVYTGGKLFGDFFSDEPVDGFCRRNGSPLMFGQ